MTYQNSEMLRLVS